MRLGAFMSYPSPMSLLACLALVALGACIALLGVFLGRLWERGQGFSRPARRRRPESVYVEPGDPSLPAEQEMGQDSEVVDGGIGLPDY